MTEDDATELSPAPAPKPASRWEDFIDILYAPADVYTRRLRAGFGIPMLVVTLLIGGIAWANSGAMQPIMDAEFTRNMEIAMAKNPALTPEMAGQMRGFGESMAKIGGFFFPPIGIFLTALALWVIGKFFDAKQTLGAAMMVTAYAYVPRIIEQVVNGVQVLLMNPESLDGRLRIALGPARFLDPDVTSPVLMNFLARIDVFTIWITVLLAIGLSVTGLIPRSKAYMAAVVLWFAGAVPSVLSALQQQ